MPLTNDQSMSRAVVSRSDDGRTVMVLDGDNDVFGSFVDANWDPDRIPSADELKDEFRRVPEPESSIWVTKARSADAHLRFVANYVKQARTE